MIIWICFRPGAGGDGFANLLEQSSNARTIDGINQWRIHRYVDSKAKFWAPNLQNSADRKNSVNLLNDRQLEIANSDTEYLIVTSHDCKFKNILSPNLLPDNKNLKVLLTSKNSELYIYNYLIKNLKEFDSLQYPNVAKKYYQEISKDVDFVLDTDKIISSWEYTKQFTLDIELNLEQEAFDHYRKIVTGELIVSTPGIEYYKSTIGIDNIVRYSKLN
jgi:hypothetical protein